LQFLAPTGTPLPTGFGGNRVRLLLYFLVFAALIALAAARRRHPLPWAPLTTLAILLAVGMTLASCGGSSSGGGGAGGGISTPAGTYTITVSAAATSGSTTLTHTTNLTLVVQ
jgi:hypothetical protein